MWRNFIVIIVLVTIVKSEYKYETKWFEVPLDHFAFQRNETFKIRYLVNEDHWDKDKGPIFFYTGNEGQIEAFAKHTGFMWEIAPEFGAKIVFAEHRYYGQSLPFGNKSLDNQHIGYLSSSQAMADYAELITYLQGDEHRYPVITFGGSYGGMLSAYMRMKYPHIVDGAIAASAPVHMFPGMVDCEVFNRMVTTSYKVVSQKCMQNIKQSWSVLRNFTKSPNDTDWLQKSWKLCNPFKNSTHVDQLIDYLSEMYVNIAMVNYPYPSDFLMDLPAEPVRVICQYLSVDLKEKELLEGIGKALQVYANYDGKSSCVNYLSSGNTNLDAAGWDYQACTEMVMPMCANGEDDMFEVSPWNFAEYSKECYNKYNVYPRENWAKIEYGGNRLEAASNIVFSNGLMDPWMAGGILNSLSDTIRGVVILDGAHHLDLMPSNPADPATVKAARDLHRKNIQFWISQVRSLRGPK